MGSYRGLLTDREREVLGGVADVTDNYRYQIRSRVREKIDRLAEDVELLAVHQPDLHAELLAAVTPAE